MLSYYARCVDFCSATLFTDLEKFYERISHARLLDEAHASGLSTKLVYAAAQLSHDDQVRASDDLRFDARSMKQGVIQFHRTQIGEEV